MVRDYRAWLQSELQLLSNASHHAYSFGQANMAKRAIERLDAEIGDRTVLELDSGLAAEVARELDRLTENETAAQPLLDLLALLRAER